MKTTTRPTVSKVFVWASMATMLASGVAVAQPPVGPDPRPKVIAIDDLERAVGGPTLVTLQFTDARPEVVFASLAKQAGVHLEAYQSTDTLEKLPAMSVDLNAVPCMVALKTLAAKLGVNFTFTRAGTFERSPTGLTLRLQPADDPQLRMEGPTLLRGPFVVIATSAQRARTIGLSEAAQERPATVREECWVDFVILADPKLAQHGLLGKPTFYGSEGWTIRPVDDEGIWRRRASETGPSPLEWRFSAHRRIAPTDPSKVPALKAKAEHLLVTTKSEVWEVRDILTARDVSKEVTLAEGTRRYTIHEIKEVDNTDLSRRGGMYAVHLGVSGVGITNGTWSGWPEVQGNILVESFRLVDAEGRDFAGYGRFDFEKLSLSGKFWSGQGRGLGKDAVGRPTRSLWSLPAEIRAIEIPIEFAALPLP